MLQLQFYKCVKECLNVRRYYLKNSWLTSVIIVDPTLLTIHDNGLDGWVEGGLKSCATFGRAGSSPNVTVHITQNRGQVTRLRPHGQNTGR